MSIANRFLAKPSLIALAAAACVSAIAQESTQTMSEVVVSASGFEQELKQAPASISVVTREELEKKSFRDLAEALQNVEGIDVRGSTGKTGGFNISMRGMPSEYTLVLIDGRRPNPAGETTPNGFGEALTSLIPPLSAIERIEVIRGPMSTLYGSDAMGGVINIITRKVAKKWGGSVQIEGSVPEVDGQGAVQKGSFYLNGPIAQDRLGLAVRGSMMKRQGSHLEPSSAGGTISTRGPSPTQSDQHNIGARLTYTPSAAHEFWLDVESARTSFSNGDCELGTKDGFDRNCNPQAPNRGSASGYTDELEFNRDQYAFGYKGNLDIGRLEASISHVDNDTRGRTLPSEAFTPGMDSSRAGRHRELSTVSTIADAKLITPIAEQHLLTIGTQYAHNTAKDGIVKLYGQNKLTQKTWALFAEDEWSITDKLTATGGLRYDHHDKFGGHWSPRAYLVWATNDYITLKGGVSRGFAAPKINRMVDGLSGMSGQGTSQSFGNPNLKPETSTSTEIGMLFDNLNGWTGSATLFHNKIKNKMISKDCVENSPSNVAGCNQLDYTDPDVSGSFYTNGDEGKTWGLELSNKIVFNPAWSLTANYTWTDSELIQSGRVTGKLGDTPKHKASATLNWDINSQWSSWLQAEYRGKSRRADTIDYNSAEYKAMGADLKAYSLLHLGAKYQVNQNVSLSATIYNLLDKDFRKFTQVNGTWYSPYIAGSRSTKGSLPDGRTLWLRANIQF
ncbi:TonB-dependent receptor domain-containing protein [Comamonas sp. NoAH]|uniref:TonB-dependent receptor domain-containing protein n=1 Tax=Comamonas halotolerans TaxID=3041496 RepID=UPI0024E14C97|nr:TonB-dependent receptor [Comamonas sp. NoAH]